MDRERAIYTPTRMRGSRRTRPGQGVVIGGVGYRPDTHGPFAKSRRRTSNSNDLVRATFVLALVAAAVAGGRMVAPRVTDSVGSAVHTVSEKHEDLETTNEQIEAKQLLMSAREGQYVTGLSAKEIRDDNGKVIPINLRNRSITEGSDETFGHGQVIDELEAGVKIGKAIVVTGDNPFPSLQDSDLRWYAFENPHKDGEVVFALASLFDPILEQYSVEPLVDFSK